jgi:peptidoglycan hydrolase CwlO-like protein
MGHISFISPLGNLTMHRFAGLSDKADILTLGQLLAGPPKTFIQDVFELLRLLKDGPRARTLAEATKIVEIMNMEEPWSAEYLLRVRNFLRGPPALTLQDLQSVLDHRGDASALQSQQDKLAELLGQVSQLRADNDALQNENSALKAEVSTLKRRIHELEQEIADLQAQLVSANKRISDLEGQLAALREELAEVMAALDASRLKECRCKPMLKEEEDEEVPVISFSKSKQTVRAQRSAAPPPPAPELAAPAPMVTAPASEPGKCARLFVVLRPGHPISDNVEPSPIYIYRAFACSNADGSCRRTSRYTSAAGAMRHRPALGNFKQFQGGARENSRGWRSGGQMRSHQSWG